MKGKHRFNDAKCVAIVNGERCGLTPDRHGIERRTLLSFKPVGHSFALAHNAKVGDTDASPAT